MRQYSAAIYANENLLLAELLERLEGDMPMLGISVYGSSLAGTTIATGTDEYEIKPVGKLDEEILVILSDPQAEIEVLKEFDGSVIDFTGTFADILDEVYIIEEPVAHIINSLQSDKNDMEAVVVLPAAVFGKSGIDDLLNQTRELFAFTNAETKLFENRLAFNMFFSDLDQGILAGYRQKLKQDTEVDVDVRMIPVSTGFVLDVYFKKDVNSNLTFSYTSDRNCETLSDITGQTGIMLVSKTQNRLTFSGDYIHTIVRQITDALKDITGDDE
ncbi:MAG: hypothetical protein C0602_02160 [Denitrovibrio sp.]|nr:MAG: hypothetical protein C0602_02160 [Denitrovibrio sp.]